MTREIRDDHDGILGTIFSLSPTRRRDDEISSAAWNEEENEESRSNRG